MLRREWCNSERVRIFASYVLVVAAGMLVLDALMVLFGGGITFQWRWVKVRSATIEFPCIALLCSIFLLLLINRKYKEAVLLSSALLCSGLIAEALLRFVDHPFSKPWVDYAAWYEPSDVYGHQLARGFEGFGPLEVPVKINSHGFRDSEHRWEKPANTIRILGLGDSFTFGWGVSPEETFLKLLEGSLSQRIGKPVETINTGVPGWGLNQYYLYLRNLGVTYAPDLIVLAYFTDDLAGPIQDAIPPNQEFKKGLQFKGGLLHYSRLYNFVKSLGNWVRLKNRSARIEYLHNEDVRRADWVKRESYLMTEGGHDRHSMYEQLLAEYLVKIKAVAEGHRADLVIMYIPDIAQLHHPEVQYINRLLQQLAIAQSIPFVDMTPVFERASHPKAYYLWPRDPHTNAKGHLEMAKALTDLICHSLQRSDLVCDGGSTDDGVLTPTAP